MNSLDVINQLRAKYQDIKWIGRRDKRPRNIPPGTLCVQFKFSELTMQITARVYYDGKRRPTRYMPVDRLEEYLIEYGKREPRVKPPSALSEGKRLLVDNKATWIWTQNHYLDVSIPASGELPPMQSWLRFTYVEPRVRKWTDQHRILLHSSGKYAWAVQLRDDYCKLFYSGPGRRVTFRSDWHLKQQFHEILHRVTSHADRYEWRRREIFEVERPARDNW